ncbi:MAG: histidine phosphatase family protein [Gammaproteobacteria bacterium]|nr:histidine phosphatase family protein [Gammaproteobacteria bacterium]
MKNLILIRHAKSSWDDPDLDDRDRPLNDRGERDAPLMGAVLKARALAPDQLLSSPARRAFKTAKLIASAIGFPVDGITIDQRIYLANTGVLLDLIQQLPDRSNQIVMFGHNPGFTDLVNLLTDAGLGNVPTCGVASIEFTVDSWAAISPGAGRLGFFDYPKRHRTQAH